MHSRPRRMPTSSKIRAYWRDADRWIERGIDPDERGWYEDCFACGWAGSTRCHIVPRHKGGSDDVSNLHILCPVCHEQSENLDEVAYWRWIGQVDPQRVIEQIMIRQGVSYPKMLKMGMDERDEETREALSAITTNLATGVIGTPQYLDQLEAIGIDIRL
jgi:HNH endonuclease